MRLTAQGGTGRHVHRDAEYRVLRPLQRVGRDDPPRLVVTNPERLYWAD